ncbi:ribonuclease 1-like [Tripterygium wilfordii]|uniref:ribonuclease 1-like n=1 Tax=Tripterygium wilfordii TaxID=458696 RepID=UPI0018F7F616|nr:ribonuclease 1-like [Tripterygium wilfordii]
MNFWKYQWERHGMCFLHPDRPSFYFQVAINQWKNHNLLNMLNTGGVRPNNRQYTRFHIESSIENRLRVAAQIVCNRDVHGTVQLKEINICFMKNASLMACPQFSNAHRNDPSRRRELIKFPTPYPTSRRG